MNLSTSSYNQSFNSEIIELQPLEWLLYLGIAVLVVMLATVGFLQPFSSRIAGLTLQTRSDMYEITQSLDTFLAGLNSLPELIQENQKLRDENTQLRSQLAQVEFVFEENQQLINETGIAYDREYEQLGVKVIGRNPNQPAVVTINKGALDGLQEGNVAVTEKILLGEVVEVQPTTAKVRLLTNAESQLPVKNSDENIGLLVGVNARELLVTQILQTKEIEIGDLVYSAGIDQRFPPDLFIGEITTIDADERASTKQAQVTSPIDWQRLDRFKILIY